MKNSPKLGHANEFEWTGELGFWGYGAFCPHCNVIIDISNSLPNTCPKCGKKILWILEKPEPEE